MTFYSDGTTVHSLNLERPRTDIRILGNLGALNAEVVLALNGETTATFDVRGTSAVTLAVEATVDGTNYSVTLPFFNQSAETFGFSLTNTNGLFTVPNVAGYRAIRVRCLAYSSGLAVVALNASLGSQMLYAKPIPTTTPVTTLTPANTASSISLPAAGTGLFH